MCFFSLHPAGLLELLVGLVVKVTIVKELAVAVARAGMEEGDRTATLRLPASMMPCRRDVTVWKSREESREPVLKTRSKS